ncbi:MAG: SOS response-associated peptidase [Pirellulales bacterium]
MCGRFTLRTSAADVAAALDVPSLPLFEPRYNIAPTQNVAVVRQTDDAPRECLPMRWGLVPSWAENPAIGNKLLNARSETAAQKPSFRQAFKRRRCLIPADGFYEWQKQGRQKQPFYIHRADDRPFALAGLWEHWDKSDQVLLSCTILTTSANGLMAQLHDRMPVILGPDDYAQWLDPAQDSADVLQPLLRPCPDDWLAAYPVSTEVNNPRHQGPELIEPAEPPPSQQALF